VCTGNICRSPMAEAMLRAALAERGTEGIEISSAGTWAGDGHSATVEAIDALAARGIDLSPHRSTALERRHLLEADIVVAMTSVHRDEIAKMAGAGGEEKVGDKLVLMKELAEIAFESADSNDRAARLRALLSGTRPEARRSLDLDDPIGLPLTAYKRCVGEIEGGIAVLAEVLA
jgi:protein-tyrosine-phosphatase